MSASPGSAPPDLRPLFPLLEKRLVALLRSLSPEDWAKPTIAGQWTVKDIVAHLLDTSLRRLSFVRDAYPGEKPDLRSHQELVAFLNRLNADWVAAMRRISPPILIELIERSSQQLFEHLQSLHLAAPAAFSVAWAGEENSQNWFDIAREYTERWHHQQQVRLAVGRDKTEDRITTRELYYPVLDTFMRALPHHYRDITAPAGAMVRVGVSGEAAGAWSILRDVNGWQWSDSLREAAAEVIIPDDIAWRVVTKGISPAQAISRSQLQGDRRLADHFFSMLAIMG